MSEPTRIVCFGELLVRLSSSDGEQLLQSPSLQVHFGGAEANVAVSLARFGHAAAMVSIVPPNALGAAAVAELRRHGVDTSGVLTGPGRMGLYFLTPGAVSRPSAVLYDRAGSAFSQAAATAIDWRAALRDARWLHLSGIASALGETAAAANQRAADAALELGVAVSFDGNYREQLWAASGGDAKRLLLGMLATAQLAFIDDRDIGLLIGFARRDGDVLERRRAAAAGPVAALPRHETLL
jgi:2-dehydro-3-deoxygluconokinase